MFVSAVLSEKLVSVSLKNKKNVSDRGKGLSSLVSGLILLSFLSSVHSAANFFDNEIDSDVLELCESENCIRSAASFQSVMNLSADPCDDFYNYACGRWPEVHEASCPGWDYATYNWFADEGDKDQKKIRDTFRSAKLEDIKSDAIKQAKIFYDSCLNTSNYDDLGLQPLYSLFDRLNISKTPGLFTHDTTHFINQTARISRVLGSDVFFLNGIIRDPKNSSQNIIYLGAPVASTFFPTFEGGLNKMGELYNTFMPRPREESEASKIIMVMRPPSVIDYMTNIMNYVLNDGKVNSDDCDSPNNYTYAVPEEDVENSAYLLLFQLLSINSLPASEESTLSKISRLTDENYLTITELEERSRKFVESKNRTFVPFYVPFFTELFKDVENFSLDQKIIATDFAYLENLGYMISTANGKIMETLLWWTIINYFLPYGPSKLRKIKTDYLRTIVNKDSVCERSLSCAGTTKGVLTLPTSKLYIESNLGGQFDTAAVNEMLDNVRISFTHTVSNVDWMDEDTKKATLEKKDKMEFFVGSPDWLNSDSKILSFYPGVNLTSKEYFGNVVQILNSRVQVALAELYDELPEDQQEWPLSPATINAAYVPQANQITVPAAILRFPFYSLGLEYLNYGAIGSVIGHEMTHGFDVSGRRFDSDGNLKQWWTNETIAQYNKNVECYEKEYSAIHEPDVNMNVDGKLTLGENIADNGGLLQSFEAYKLWKSKHGQEPKLPGFSKFTHEQLFFLSYAHMFCESYTTAGLKGLLQSEHSPLHVRVQTVMRNSKEFSEAWKCPSGSAMNPEKKCQLW